MPGPSALEYSPSYESIDADNPTVKLSFDMRDYLEAVAQYKDSNNEEDIVSLKDRVGEFVKTEIGPAIWEDILNCFKKSIKIGWQDIGDLGSKESSPLAICAMENSCHELVKNSMDGLIDRYLRDGPDSPTTLEMIFTLERRSPKTITLKIQDNGIGFSNKALEKYSPLCNTTWDKFKEVSDASFDTSLSYKNNSISAAPQESLFYFGGAGKGLLMLTALVKHGKIPSMPLDITRFNDVESLGTQMVLSNSGNGATIEITTPMARPVEPSNAYIRSVNLTPERIASSTPEMIVDIAAYNKNRKKARSMPLDLQSRIPNTSAPASLSANHVTSPDLTQGARVSPDLNQSSSVVFKNELIKLKQDEEIEQSLAEQPQDLSAPK